MIININKTIIFLLIFSGILLVFSCNRTAELAYTEIRLQTTATEFVSKEIPAVISCSRYNDKLIVISKGLWLIDLAAKTQNKFIEDGVGPNEVYSPDRIRAFNDKFYIKSFFPGRFLFSIPRTLDDPKVTLTEFATTYSFDDFQLLSDNKVALVNAYWEDSLLKIYDFKSQKSTLFEAIKPKTNEIMLKFNLSRASLQIVGDKAYITQSIVPEIKVISLSLPRKALKHITLSPPFHVPPPEKYLTGKQNHKLHKEWMAKWSSVFDLLSYKNWLLVVYRWGYNYSYCYELINIKNTAQRYYISRTPSCIYEFKITGQRAEFSVFEEDEAEETLVWKKAEALLK